MSRGIICIGLYWNVNYAWYLWMFNRYVVCCLAHCATGSIRLALTNLGAHGAKWVYREKCDLAGAALQALPVYVCVCVSVQVLLFALPGQLFSSGHTEPLQCAVTLWWIDGHCAVLRQDSNPQSEGRRQGETKGEGWGVGGEMTATEGGRETQSWLTDWLTV